MEPEYGARIERGTVTEKTESGYRIKSLTRDGVNTPPLSAFTGVTADVGDDVYFFMFDDGKGAVLSVIA